MTPTRMTRASLVAGSTLAIATPPLAEHATTPQSREDALTDTIIVTAQRRDTIASDAIAAPRQIALPADAAGSYAVSFEGRANVTVKMSGQDTA